MGVGLIGFLLLALGLSAGSLTAPPPPEAAGPNPPVAGAVSTADPYLIPGDSPLTMRGGLLQ